MHTRYPLYIYIYLEVCYIYNIYVKKCACVYVGLKLFHDACIILYTCKSSLYFYNLHYFLVVVYKGPHARLAFFLAKCVTL